MKRSIEIEHLDGTKKELEIGKVISMNSKQGGKLYLEEMNDGKWRLLATTDIIEDFTLVKGFNIVRED
jgi:hypothetical protein